MKDRIALVIGNSDYIHVNKLNNPRNDANDIEGVLNRLNFDVTRVTDVNLIDLQQAINTFLKEFNKTKGYSLILSNTGLDNLLYANESFNITQEILEGLNARYSSTKKK